ncbi:MAG: hypothetical protein WC791_00425 [Candidatus Paceibacterota bacterium]|jgi:hypothetical protein
MDGTNPKVSFIPKGSLVHQDSFLERSRPRSVIGIIAIFVFVITVAAYVSLLYYNDSLNNLVAQKKDEIKSAQKEFSDAPEVAEAQMFRARADLARQLLNAHTVVSPVFTFLSQNTIGSVLYKNFSFVSGSDGTVVNVSGEAPTYAALAYQADVLRSKNKELTGVSVDGVGLTEFGTILFSLTLTFRPDYLLYTKNLNSSEVVVSQSVAPSNTITPTLNVGGEISTLTPSLQATTTSESSTSSLIFDSRISTTSPSTNANTPSSDTLESVSADTATTSSSEATTATTTVFAEQSFLQRFWSKLKFW